MIEMTQHVNENWQPHVAQTGVTCYTATAASRVPANVWSRRDLGPGENRAGLVGWRKWPEHCQLRQPA